MKKQKKLLLTGAVVALMAICVPNFNPQASSNEEIQQEVLSKVSVQGTSVSLNGIVNALGGTVTVDETNADKATFKAQDKEIVTTNGSGVVLVNGEEDVYVVDKDIEDSTMNLVKWVEAYSYQDEVFVPIQFVERVFDLTYDEESLGFNKGEETVIEVEVIEELQEEETEDDSELNGPSEEEEKEEDKETDEPSQEETDKVESETENNNSNTGSTNTGSTNNGSNNSGVTSKPNNSGSSNSASGNTGSNNSGSASKPNNSGSSNAGSNNSAPAPAPKPQEPVTPPAPQPVKVTSITTDKVSLTLEVGQTGKMTANVQPSNADNKGVTFVSSNTSVATVDGNGNITAKGAGSALITAKSNENGNISVSIGVTVNAKPAPQPTYTGSSIVNRAVNELGWCRRTGYEKAFLGPYGCQTGPDGESVSINAHNGYNGWDVTISIFDSTAAGVVSGVESIIRWMMPSQGQQLINKLHDPNYYGGTHTLDGRKVVVSIKSYGIAIDIYAKY